MSRRLVFLTVASLVLSTVPGDPAESPPAEKIREPAVAGLFYPADPAVLTKAIDSYLAAAQARAPAPLPGRLRALICPHAGYAYSGPVAAAGFRLLPGSGFTTVLLLAPSHYAYLRAASVSAAEVFRTPLGSVRISPRARQLAKLPPFELEPVCYVQRPDWAAQSSRPAPAGRENADTWEHADEVEVPFLQRTLGSFQLVPVVCGEIDPAAAAAALAQVLDDETLIVISSDLSHYHPYAEARELDRRCVAAICALEVTALDGESACGRLPILTLLHLARQRGWQAQLLDCRNSGDTAGDKSRVVGYAAIAFYEPPAGAFTSAEREQLLGLARATLRAVTSAGKPPPAPAAADLTAGLNKPKGCFVTLTRGGALRGCIGNIAPRLPLWQAVVDNARSAALRDPRFHPVRSDEVDRIEIEISVLTEPVPLAFSSPDDLLRQLQPGKDGVVLSFDDGRGATYLPQVWEQLADKGEFLDSLAEKAGRSRGDWRKPGVAVAIYHVEAFTETAR